MEATPRLALAIIMRPHTFFRLIYSSLGNSVSAQAATMSRLDFTNGIHYMESEYYEWDDAKAEANLRKHRVRFEHAIEACEDSDALIELDDSEDYDEDRFILIGRATDGVLAVVYTERNSRIRIISAREANDYERRNYRRAAQEE
jgi:uncharacterized DUF497 family protein